MLGPGIWVRDGVLARKLDAAMKQLTDPLSGRHVRLSETRHANQHAIESLVVRRSRLKRKLAATGISAEGESDLDRLARKVSQIEIRGELEEIRVTLSILRRAQSKLALPEFRFQEAH